MESGTLRNENSASCPKGVATLTLGCMAQLNRDSIGRRTLNHSQGLVPDFVRELSNAGAAQG